MLLAILVKGHDYVWLRAQQYDCNYVGYSDIKVDMLQHFTPADSERWARDALAQCTQHHNTQVTGHITAFIRAAQKVPRMTEGENLYHFLHGIKAPIFKKVLMADMDSFADAFQAVERAAAILSYVQDRQHSAEKRYPRMDTSNSRFYSQGPMVLDTTAAQDEVQPSRHPHDDGRYQGQQLEGYQRRQFQRQYYNCGTHGNISRDCWYHDRTDRPQQQGRQQQGNHQFMGQYSGPQQQGNFQFWGSQKPGYQMYGTVLLPLQPPPYDSQLQVQDPQPKNGI